MSKRQYKTFWDYVAGTGGLYQMGPSKYRKYILDAIDNLGVITILEEGCGTGPIFELIDKNKDEGKWFFSYKGTDFASEMIKVAKEHFPGGRFEVQDARNPKEKSNSYDCVLLIDTLDHLDDYKSVIREAARIARKCVAISLWRDFVAVGTNLNNKNMMNLAEGEEPWEDTHLQEYSQEVLETEFKKNNLEIIDFNNSEDVHEPGRARSVYILKKV